MPKVFIRAPAAGYLIGEGSRVLAGEGALHRIWDNRDRRMAEGDDSRWAIARHDPMPERENAYIGGYPNLRLNSVQVPLRIALSYEEDATGERL